MIDLENLLEGLFGIIKNSGSASVLICAIVVCILTQLIKVAILPKLKIDLLNKFDPSVIIPFVLGVTASVGMILINCGNLKSLDVWYGVVIQGLTIGATATVIFRFFAAMSPHSVKKLCKNELFSVVYSHMLVFGGAKQKLLNKEIKLTQFVGEVKLVVEKLTQIYSAADDQLTKRTKLVELMRGIIPDSVISASVDSLHVKLMEMFKTNSKVKESIKKA